MKLEYITPYLPYGLKSIDKYPDGKPLIRDINVNNIMAFVDRDIRSKLILIHLSSFEKKPCLELMKDFNCSMEVIHEVWKLIQKEIKLEDITLKTYNMMCKNYIDFNRLIEKELAVNVNDL